MPEWLTTLLNLLAQFTGGRGGIDNVIVNYAIAGFFWGVLWRLAVVRQRQSPASREALLVWGFGLAMARELFMIFLALLQALEVVDPVSLHVIFPPLEHELHDLSLVLVAGAFLRFLLNDSGLLRIFLRAGLTVTVTCYLVTFSWWADYITAHPTSKFGQTWPDWVFHINRSLWALVPAVILARRAHGWIRNAVVTAFVFFFIHAALKIPDMALGEVYEDVFTPISRSFYLLGIPIFGYVYIREQWQGRQLAEQALQEAHAQLESQVHGRTRELEKALTKEETAVADLEAFSYSVAHDLKAPLRAMEGFSDALREDYGPVLDATAHEYLEHITGGAIRLNCLIDDLLRYSRLGREGLEFEEIDLDALLERLLFDLQGDIEATGAEIRIVPDLPRITGHRPALVSILQNLISNAIKYTAAGCRPEISVTADSHDGELLLSVADRGIGIDPRHKNRIFEIFHRLHGANDYTGTGIGLAMVKKAVDLHGGTIDVESELGSGSTFSIRLPQKESAEPPRPLTCLA